MANVNSINDGFFIAAKEGFVTTTSGPVTSGATTVGLNSVAGYSNGDWVTLVINPTTPASKQVFHGQIDASGSQVINVEWTEGTNIPHLAGATVVDYETATAWMLLRKGMEVSHNQDGTLKEAAIVAGLGAGSLPGSKIEDEGVTTDKLTVGSPGSGVGTVLTGDGSSATFWKTVDPGIYTLGTGLTNMPTPYGFVSVTKRAPADEARWLMCQGSTGLFYTAKVWNTDSGTVTWNLGGIPNLGGAWQSWTPTLTGWSGTPTVSAKYQKIGRTVHVFLSISGTSNNAHTTVSLPYPSANNIMILVQTSDGSSDRFGLLYGSGSPLVSRLGFNQSSGGHPYSAWAASGTKRINGASFSYEATS